MRILEMHVCEVVAGGSLQAIEVNPPTALDVFTRPVLGPSAYGDMPLAERYDIIC